jgi:hypothetical protein
MVEERSEPFLPIQPCSCPYTIQSRGHACPARGPARAGLSRVLLGPFPSLHPLHLARVRWDRGFESGFLQRRVSNEPAEGRTPDDWRYRPGSASDSCLVLFWSRATRDLFKSFGWGIVALHRLDAATKLPRPRRPPHSIYRSRSEGTSWRLNAISGPSFSAQRRTVS